MGAIGVEEVEAAVLEATRAEPGRRASA